MTIPTLNLGMYYQNQNDSMSSNQDSNRQNSMPTQLNDLRSVYVDSDIISELTLKAAHTPEILSQKLQDNKENKSLKNINFEKESKSFDKSSIGLISGDLKTTQANISSKKVMELLS